MVEKKQRRRMNGLKPVNGRKPMLEKIDIWVIQEHLKTRFEESLKLRDGRTVKELVREANKRSRTRK